MNRLVFDVHRGAAWSTPHTFRGDHDMSCGAPTTSRDVHENIYSETVWYCGNLANPHFMTGMNTVAITFGATVAAATEVRIPYEEPAIRNASGGFVSTSTFPV